LQFEAERGKRARDEKFFHHTTPKDSREKETCALGTERVSGAGRAEDEKGQLLGWTLSVHPQ